MFDHLCLSLMNRWRSCPFKTVVRESYWLANAHCWLEIKPLVVSCLSLLDTATRALCSSSTLIRVMQQKRMCSSQEEMQVLSSALSGSCLTIAAWATVMTHSSGPTISSASWGRVIWWLRKTAWPLQKLCSLCFYTSGSGGTRSKSTTDTVTPIFPFQSVALQHWQKPVCADPFLVVASRLSLCCPVPLV